MSNPSFLDSLQQKGTDAAYRVAARQSAEAVHKVVVDTLQKRGGDNGATIALFADNDIGKALVSFGLGVALERLPVEAAKGQKAKRLAAELQTGGMEMAGNLAVGAVMQELVPMIINILSGLPEVPENARVSTEVPAQLTQGTTLEEQVAAAPAPAASVRMG